MLLEEQAGGKYGGTYANAYPYHGAPAAAVYQQAAQRGAKHHRSAGKYHIQGKTLGDAGGGKLRYNVRHYHGGDGRRPYAHHKAGDQHKQQTGGNGSEQVAQSVYHYAQYQRPAAAYCVSELAQHRGAGGGGHGGGKGCPCGVVVGQAKVAYKGGAKYRGKPSHKAHQQRRKGVGQESFHV